MATLEERLNTLADDYTVFIREQGQEVREIKSRLATMDTRLGAMDARLATVDNRLNRMEEKVDAVIEDIGTLRADMSEAIGVLGTEMNRKFDQILALLAPGNPSK